MKTEECILEKSSALATVKQKQTNAMTSVFVSVGGHRRTQALGPQWSPGDGGKWLNPGCSQQAGPTEEGVRDEGGPHRPGWEAEKGVIFGGSFAFAGRRGGRAACPQETHLYVLRPS